MCSKDEVREVIRENVAPAWMRYILGLLGSGVVILLSWLLWTAHIQEGSLKDFKTEIAKSMSILVVNSTVNNARLTGKIELLTSELKNIREITVTKNAARSNLVDERCKMITERLNNLELTLKELMRERNNGRVP